MENKLNDTVKSLRSRVIVYILFNIASIYLLHKMFNISEKQEELLASGKALDNNLQSDAIVFICAVLLLQILSLYQYLKEIIIIFDHSNNGWFWLIRRFVILILNISLLFTFIYMMTFLHFPDSINVHKSAIGCGFGEQFFNFFYFSTGNFFGFDSSIEPASIAFKAIRLLQSFISLFLIVFVLGHFEQIKLAFRSKDNSIND